MSIIKVMITTILMLTILGCAYQSAQKGNFDKNVKIDMSGYKTFAWLKEDKILSVSDDINPVMKLRVDDAIQAAFIVKGYTLVDDAESADFTITYTVGSRDKIKVDNFPSSYHNPFLWGRSYYGGFSLINDTRIHNYTEGKLAIDVYDVKAHQPAWHGWAVQRMNSEFHKEKVINRLIEQVLVNF